MNFTGIIHFMAFVFAVTLAFAFKEDTKPFNVAFGDTGDNCLEGTLVEQGECGNGGPYFCHVFISGLGVFTAYKFDEGTTCTIPMTHY